MKPRKGVLSRYATNVNKGNYGTLGIKGNSQINAGYFYAPYIPLMTTDGRSLVRKTYRILGLIDIHDDTDDEIPFIGYCILCHASPGVFAGLIVEDIKSVENETLFEDDFSPFRNFWHTMPTVQIKPQYITE